MLEDDPTPRGKPFFRFVFRRNRIVRFRGKGKKNTGADSGRLFPFLSASFLLLAV